MNTIHIYILNISNVFILTKKQIYLRMCKLFNCYYFFCSYNSIDIILFNIFYSYLNIYYAGMKYRNTIKEERY